MKYLDRVRLFADFLADRDYSLNQILTHMNRVVLMDLEPTSIQFGQANTTGGVVITAVVGNPMESLSSLALIELENRTPWADAIRHGKVVIVNTLPEWGPDYPLAKNFPVSSGAKSAITLPIYVSGTPIAAIHIMSKRVLLPNVELESFLKTLSSVFSMYFYRNVLSSPDEIDDLQPKNQSRNSDAHGNSLELTERQLVILRLISEERTNLSISQFLGYSESTVRQEIMKIFDKLGCTHRHEAGAIYKDYSSKHL
jgi:DNA-binding CsgD family transcriptional regulator